MTRTPSLTVQTRVLGALMVREMITRYGRSGLGFLWAVLEPVGVIALLSLLFMQIAHAPPIGRSFVLFYASGYLAFHWVHDIGAVAARSVHVNRPLLAFPGITALDMVLARFALQVLSGLAVAVVVLVPVLWWFEDPVALDPRPLMAAFGLATALGLGIGLVNCWLFALSRTWEVVWGIVSRPLFLVSCVFFSFASMPAAVREVLWFNPVVHLVGLMRAGIYPAYEAGHVAPAYVGAVAAALIVSGMLGLRAIPARLVSP